MMESNISWFFRSLRKRGAKRQSPVFEVMYVQHPLTDDMEMERDGTPIVKNVKDFKKSLGPILADSVPGISKFRGLLFSKNGSYAKNVTDGK